MGTEPKREPTPQELDFLKGIFRRVGEALSGLDDGAINHLVGGMEMAAATLKQFRAQVRSSRG